MQIFISYRRVDSSGIAGRIEDRLRDRYGPETVFRDVTDMQAGVEFPEQLREAIEKSEIFLALVGPAWITGGDFSASDFVCTEVETALKCRLQVIPLLVDGATMPKAAELPESICTIANLHAERVDSGVDFNPHMDRLFQVIEAQEKVRTSLDQHRRIVRHAGQALQNLDRAGWDLSADVEGDQIVFLLTLKRILESTRPLFELQIDLARNLLQGITPKQEGLDDAIREAADEIPADRYWLRRRLRHETDNMRQVHGSLLRLLSRNRDLQSLVPSLSALYEHLSLWVAKYEFLREDEGMCLVFVGVKQDKRFPPNVETEINHALNDFDRRMSFSL